MALPRWLSRAKKSRSVVEGGEVQPSARIFKPRLGDWLLTSNPLWREGCGTLSRKKIFEQRWRQIFRLKLFKIRISQVFTLIESFSYFLSSRSATVTFSAGMAGASGCFHAKNVKWRHLMFFLDFSIFGTKLKNSRIRRDHLWIREGKRKWCWFECTFDTSVSCS